MKPKSILSALVLGTAVLLARTERALAQENRILPFDTEIGVDVATKYVWRGQLLTDDPVIQPSATLSWKGLSLNVWGSIDATDVNEGSGEEYRLQEVDYTLSYGFTPTEGLDLEAGFITYTFPGTGLYTTEEVYGSVSLSRLPLTPTLAVYYDVDEVEGFYVNLSVDHTFQLTEKLALGLGAGIGWADSDYNTVYFGVNDSGLGDVSIGASLDYAVNERVSISAHVGYTAFADDDIRDAADAGYGDSSNLVCGVNLSMTF
ncbi:MAG: hypothetical protein GXP31_03855 [Kiritimatiellaeota bacterium]|nr:hypothetical protein [Kiritimatiellota bacterium]